MTILGTELMPSLHLACDELTVIVQCLNSHLCAVSVRRLYDIVQFLARLYKVQVELL